MSFKIWNKVDFFLLLYFFCSIFGFGFIFSAALPLSLHTTDGYVDA